MAMYKRNHWGTNVQKKPLRNQICGHQSSLAAEMTRVASRMLVLLLTKVTSWSLWCSMSIILQSVNCELVVSSRSQPNRQLNWHLGISSSPHLCPNLPIDFGCPTLSWPKCLLNKQYTWWCHPHRRYYGRCYSAAYLPQQLCSIGCSVIWRLWRLLSGCSIHSDNFWLDCQSHNRNCTCTIFTLDGHAKQQWGWWSDGISATSKSVSWKLKITCCCRVAISLLDAVENNVPVLLCPWHPSHPCFYTHFIDLCSQQVYKNSSKAWLHFSDLSPRNHNTLPVWINCCFIGHQHSIESW